MKKPTLTCSEFCIKCDNSKKNIYKLDELSDYLVTHKEVYPKIEYSFMYEHLKNSYK